MKRQHTPGPWQSKQLCFAENDGYVILWPDKGGSHMRRLDDKGHFSAADAALIAAAPELLAAAIKVDALSIQSEAHKALREVLKKLEE